MIHYVFSTIVFIYLIFFVIIFSISSFLIRFMVRNLLKQFRRKPAVIWYKCISLVNFENYDQVSIVFLIIFLLFSNKSFYKIKYCYYHKEMYFVRGNGVSPSLIMIGERATLPITFLWLKFLTSAFKCSSVPYTVNNERSLEF